MTPQIHTDKVDVRFSIPTVSKTHESLLIPTEVLQLKCRVRCPSKTRWRFVTKTSVNNNTFLVPLDSFDQSLSENEIEKKEKSISFLRVVMSLISLFHDSLINGESDSPDHRLFRRSRLNLTGFLSFFRLDRSSRLRFPLYHSLRKHLCPFRTQYIVEHSGPCQTYNKTYTTLPKLVSDILINKGTLRSVIGLLFVFLETFFFSL